MKLVNVATVALNQLPLDLSGNSLRIRAALEQARADGASIVCLPEMAISGYGSEDVFLSSSYQQSILEKLLELVPETQGLIVAFSLPLAYQSLLYNAVCVCADGKILGFVAKRNLPVDGVHYEPRWFKPWPRGLQAEIAIAGTDYPIGDYLFDIGGVRLGIEICEDAWVANRPGRSLSVAGVDVILNPSASHFAFGKVATREQFIAEGSRAFSCCYLYANLLGNEAGRLIYDGSSYIASQGSIVNRGQRFSFDDFTLTSATVDLDLNSLVRARSAASEREGEIGSYHEVIEAPFSFPAVSEKKKPLAVESWEQNSSEIKEQEFTRAVALGLFDYLRKSKAKGFVVSLSGGADSSACACLIALSLHLANQELGFARLKKRLGSTSEACSSVEELTKELLTCVYVATDNSSDRTLGAAKELATALHASFQFFGIQGVVDQYRSLVEENLKEKLSWEKNDIPLQNIQARARGPLVWMIANLERKLLVATSNRSEAAVGYTTMDGDTCGGLSPIGGIDKAFLRSWLSWLEKGGLAEFGALSTLSLVTSQTPTAELRPESSSQTDESDLMPYPVLDMIERLAIRDKHSPEEVVELLSAESWDYSLSQVLTWVIKFFRLWSINQWKRERYAPSFHVDDENLDPKTWCRFPILSSGYADELAALQIRLDNLPS